jgi:hypothetical protein
MVLLKGLEVSIVPTTPRGAELLTPGFVALQPKSIKSPSRDLDRQATRLLQVEDGQHFAVCVKLVDRQE